MKAIDFPDPVSAKIIESLFCMSNGIACICTGVGLSNPAFSQPLRKPEVRLCFEASCLKVGYKSATSTKLLLSI